MIFKLIFLFICTLFLFRPRTQSILSVPGSSSRLSPTQQEPPGFEDFDFPPYRDSTLNRLGGNNGSVSELLDRTDQMRIDGEFRPLQAASSNAPINCKYLKLIQLYLI